MESPGEEFHAAEGPAVAEERAVVPHRRPQCLHCQYDLTGFAVGQVCPECGKKIRALVPHGKSLPAARLVVKLGCGAAGSLVFGAVMALLSMVFLGTIASTLLAILGLLCFMLSLPLSYIGLIGAGAAWWDVRHNPYLYTPNSMMQVKIGLCLCLIPTVLFAVIYLA